ncbi:MAG: MFS transporter [Acidimicrobiales bacterium]
MSPSSSCGAQSNLGRDGGAGAGAPKSAHPDRDFRLLWGGETVSQLGSQVSQLALPLVAVTTLHATVFEVGLLTAATTLAFLLVGLPAGAWVDRLRRRPVLIGADIGRLLIMGSVPVAAALGDLTIAQLYVVALLAGVLTVFFDVAYQSYLPALVGRDRLVNSNSRLQTSESLAQVAGPSLAGWLVQTVGGPYAVAVDAASFAVSAAAVAAIKAHEDVPARADRHRGALWREMGEGLRFVVRHPILRAIAATTSSANLFGMFAAAVDVVFLVRTVHVHSGEIGLLFAGGSLGGVLGALSASTLSRRIGGARTTMLGIVTSSIGQFLFPLTRGGVLVVLFAVGFFLSSYGAVTYNINQVSYRQRLCPPELLGRMNATMRFIVWGTMPIGAVVGGVLGSAFGTRDTLWISAFGEIVPVLVLLSSPIGTRRDYPDTPDWDSARA